MLPTRCEHRSYEPDVFRCLAFFCHIWPGERQEATRDQGRWAGTYEERPGDPGCGCQGLRKAQGFNVERFRMIW